MRPEPRARLAEILQQYGTELVDDPRRLESLLRDLCPDRRLETNLLVTALREGVVAALQAANPTLPVVILLAQQAGQLETQTGLSADAARWAVESWAAALGMIPAEPEPASAPAEPAIAPDPSVAPDPIVMPPGPTTPPVGHTATLRLMPPKAWSGCRRIVIRGKAAYLVTVPPQTSDGDVVHVAGPMLCWDTRGAAGPLTVTVLVYPEPAQVSSAGGYPPGSPAPTSQPASSTPGVSPAPASQPAISTPASSPAPWSSPAPTSQPAVSYRPAAPAHGVRSFNYAIVGLLLLFVVPIATIPLFIVGWIEAGKALPGDADFAKAQSAIGIVKWTTGLLVGAVLFFMAIAIVGGSGY